MLLPSHKRGKEKRIMDKEILESIGIDYDEAIERFSGSVELFEEFLTEIATRDVLLPLKNALKANDVMAVFMVAHTLKGNFGNLSAKPLYETVTPLVEELRHENMLEAQKLYVQLEEQYKVIAEGIKKA